MQTFIHDIAPKRALRAVVLRAPFRKGSIISLSEPALPKGYFRVGPEDIPGTRVLSCAGFSLPVLARGEVRYLGEPLLLFCGPNPEVLAQISADVEIAYQEEAPVEYRDLSGPYREEQIINLAQGDVDLAFSLAEQIVEGEYRTARQEHCYPDTQGALADWDGKSLTVHAATQDPFGLRSALGLCLNLPPRKVRVVAIPVGNSMEGKLLSSFLVAVQAAALSFTARGPVVLIYDREEDLRFSAKGPEFLIRHQTALDQEGETLAVRVQIYMDGGCYASKNSEALHRAVHGAWGAYRVANLEVTGRTMATDFPPVGPFRAAGRAQAAFAAELHSSRLEEVAQLDSCTWKRKNLVEPPGKQAPPSALEVMDLSVGISDFTRKYSAYSAVKKRRKAVDQAAYPLRGIGLSLACQRQEGAWECLHESGESRGACSMKLVLDRGRRLRIYTSLVDCSMGIHWMLIQRAAELLDIDPLKVTVQPVDTRDVPDTGMTSLSRAAGVGLPLLEQCCRAIMRKRKQVSPPIEVRRSIAPPLAAAREQASGGARGERFKDRQGRVEPSWAATVVEVELDPVTFHSECRGIWMVVESGRVWNSREVLAVMEGEVLRALGSVRMPGCQAAAADGAPACSIRDLMPDPEQLPEIRIRLLDRETEPMRGFEELPHMGVPAAYAAAVCQATGLYIDQIPITAEVIQQCLET
ncbi:MAG: xanthine dehydrogenase family protein [Spirochaetales bacterium]|nr:xanthine dehydrogenase family protein [Spirochaetales bacterium]